VLGDLTSTGHIVTIGQYLSPGPKAPGRLQPVVSRSISSRPFRAPLANRA